MKKKGIIGGIVALAAIGALVSPDEKKIESIELSIPAYQSEYDINTDIPISVSIFPEDADASSLEYLTNGEAITFSSSGINTGSEEGLYEIHVMSGDIESNSLSINVVDISAREEIALKEEEELLAKAQAEKEAEEQKLADEQAQKEAEAQKLADEQAQKEAEAQKLADEQAQKEAETQKLADEQAQKETEVQSPKSEPVTQNTATDAANTSTSVGDGSNFNTYDNASQQQTEALYVLNTSTMKIHHPSCSSVKKIAPDNYSTSNSSVDDLISQGYSTCGNCFK